jgi:hypothetical protein
VKIVRGGGADDVLVKRFKDERRILATFEHPHIARLIDGGATPNGLPYVVMEYVEGLPIDLYCEQHALDLRRRIHLFQRVCLAVDYAHQHLVVHRDIKASHILVTGDGDPKLLDFGIAKVLQHDAPGEPTLVRIITPESASPEQLRGEPITTATDVYALGVLLYRLTTGRSPYRLATGSDAELIEAVCVQEPAPPGTIDADVDRIILKALRKDPDRRYHGAHQLSGDLQRYLEGRPVLAAPDSRAYRMRKFATRHRLGLAAAALIALAIAGGSAATIWQARVAARERDRAGRGRGAPGLDAGTGAPRTARHRVPGYLVARGGRQRRPSARACGRLPEAGGSAGGVRSVERRRRDRCVDKRPEGRRTAGAAGRSPRRNARSIGPRQCVPDLGGSGDEHR